MSLKLSQSGSGGCNGVGVTSSLVLSVAAIKLSVSVLVIVDRSIAGEFERLNVAAAHFSRKQCFFMAFRLAGVSMVTKKGNVALDICK